MFSSRPHQPTRSQEAPQEAAARSLARSPLSAHSSFCPSALDGSAFSSREAPPPGPARARPHALESVESLRVLSSDSTYWHASRQPSNDAALVTPQQRSSGVLCAARAPRRCPDRSRQLRTPRQGTARAAIASASSSSSISSIHSPATIAGHGGSPRFSSQMPATKCTSAGRHRDSLK